MEYNEIIIVVVIAIVIALWVARRKKDGHKIAGHMHTCDSCGHKDMIGSPKCSNCGAK